MLIYFKKKDETGLFLAEVITTAPGIDVSIFKKNIWGIPKAHQQMLLRMKEDEILIAGNSSLYGDGIFKDNYMAGVTEINSKHPKIFIPVSPDHVPGAKEIENKYKKSLQSRISSYVVKRRSEWKKNPRETKALTAAEVDEFETYQKGKLEVEKAKELAALNSYKESGNLIEPEKVSPYRVETTSSFGMFPDQMMQLADAVIIGELAKKYGEVPELKKAIENIKKARSALDDRIISHVSEFKSKDPESTISIESILGDMKDTQEIMPGEKL